MRGSISPAQEFLLRLIAELERTPPERFDYGVACEPCGCVMPAANRVRLGHWTSWPLTRLDVYFLTTSAVVRRKYTERHRQLSSDEARGANGLREAIRRCRVVLARLTPPTPKER